jgi:ATP-dependent protease ClpP protease subunit
MKWYKIENKADRAEIWLYDEIGEDWWTGGGVTAKAFQKEISAIKAPQIDLHINSPGGSVFDGVTIYNLIKQHPANVTTYIDGIAASIASVIALAGDRVVMAENAIYMIHSPSGGVYGKSSDMRSFADVLDKINGTMVGTYVAKTGKPEDEISAMLDTETWLDQRVIRNLQARAFLQRYTAVASPTASVLWLGYRIETALGDTSAAQEYGRRLKADFAVSTETGLLLDAEKARP